MSVRSKIGRLFSNKRPPELHRDTVVHERVDKGVLDDWKQRSTKLGAIYDEAPTNAEGDAIAPEIWQDCLDDAFYQYFGYDEPKVRAAGEVQESRQVNRTLHEKLSRSDDIAKTRPMTRNKAMESALALSGYAGSLAESWRNELSEHMERAEDLANQQQVIDDIEQQLAEMRELNQQAAEDGDPLPAEADAFKDLIERREKRVAAVEEIKQSQNQNAVALQGAIQKAQAKAAAAGAKAAEAASQIPGVGIGKTPGQEANLPPDVMLELAAKWANSHVLKQIAEILGNLLPDMRTMRRTMRKGGYEEIVDIEFGNDIPVVLPSELARAAHPLMKFDFYKRFVEGQLQQYEMWSTEELKKGPMILVIDESSSMSGPKIIWAKALAIALVFIANREHRNAAVVCFGSVGQVDGYFFPRGRPVDPVELTKMAEHFFSGGTSTISGIEAAMQIMRDDAPFHKADLVIGSDGADDWTERDAELKAELKGMGVYIHGVAIGLAPTQYLLDWCDHTTPVYDFEGKNSTTDRLATHIA